MLKTNLSASEREKFGTRLAEAFRAARRRRAAHSWVKVAYSSPLPSATCTSSCSGPDPSIDRYPEKCQSSTQSSRPRKSLRQCRLGDRWRGAIESKAVDMVSPWCKRWYCSRSSSRGRIHSSSAETARADPAATSAAAHPAQIDLYPEKCDAYAVVGDVRRDGELSCSNASAVAAFPAPKAAYPR